MRPSDRIETFLQKPWEEKVLDYSIFLPQRPGKDSVRPCAHSDEDIAER